MNSFLDKLFRWLRFRKIIKYIPEDSVVCDIGCGSNAYLLKKIFASIKKGVGLDKDIEDYQCPKLEIKKGKIFRKIPLEKESFDVVSLVAVLEHLDYPQEVLNETFRILKKDGNLIITTPTPLAKPILKSLAKLKMIDRDEVQDHKNYFWPKEIINMLLEAKFKRENIKNCFFDIYLNNLIIVRK